LSEWTEEKLSEASLRLRQIQVLEEIDRGRQEDEQVPLWLLFEIKALP
jgi:hypothetical protein